MAKNLETQPLSEEEQAKLNAALLDAATKGDVDKVKAFIKDGAV